MKQLLYLTLASLLTLSCTQKRYHVEGQLSDAQGKTIYLERAGVSRTTILDSTQLDRKGKFSFAQPAVAAPEFLRLRYDNQYINLSIDSTETVSIEATPADFATNYTVKGSPESEKIKTITLKANQLRTQLDLLNKQRANRQVSNEQFQTTVTELIATYKAQVTPFIFENPRSAAAYFALFQRVNGLLIFDPYSSDDYRVFGAVATSWDTYYKENERATQLLNITLDALRLQRKQRAIASGEILDESIAEVGQIEIALPDLHGRILKLSDLKGKVVLLDFTAYGAEYSASYNIQLAKLYEKYRQRGLEIYQVSIDSDEHFWKTVASNLPWISVRDKEGTQSRHLLNYNVTTLPTIFLLGRDGAILLRGSDTKNMEAEILKLL